MKRLMFVVGAVAVGSAFAAGQEWNGGSAGNDLSTAANWSRNLSVIYDPTKTYSGGEIPGEADLNLWVRKDVPEARKITLAQDITTGRLSSDSANKEIYLDFSGHTLTLNGICGVALHQNGDNGKIHYLGGKVVIPYNSSWPYSCCLALSYNNNTKHDLRFFIGDGTGTAEIDTYKVLLAYGTNNAVVVKNNGVLKCRGDQVTLGQKDSSNPSFGFHNGIVLDGGTFVNTAESPVLAINAGSGYSKNAYFEMRSGSALQNVDYVTLAGTGASFILNGTGVSFTQAMNNRWEIYNGGCVIVSNGASFLMDSGAGKVSGSDRVWLNGGGKLVADGEGTVLRINGSENATSLLGQGSNDNRIEAKNGALMILDPANNSGNVNIGQGSAKSHEFCQDNAVIVDGGVLIAGSIKIGGAANGNGAPFAQSNRYEIVNGGVATNRHVYVSGDGYEDRYNTCLVSNKSSLVANYLVVGYYGYGNRFVVADHSTVMLNNDLRVGWDWTYAGTNEAVEVSGGSVVNVTGSLHDLGYNTDWIVDDGKITATELHFHRQGNPSGSTPGSRMIIAGKNPVLKATREADADLLVFRTTSHVTFQLPEGGYAEAPLQAPGGKVSAWDMTFDFDLSKLPTKLEGEYSTTLATAKALNINAGAQNSMKNNFASAIQAKYGDTVSKAEITFSKTDVTLTMKPKKKGMLLIFR